MSTKSSLVACPAYAEPPIAGGEGSTEPAGRTPTRALESVEHRSMK